MPCRSGFSRDAVAVVGRASLPDAVSPCRCGRGFSSDAVPAVTPSLSPVPRRPSPSVVVIGLDGADPHLVRRFIDQGHLPHLASLAERGTLEPLLSSPNAMSPAAWSSFVTGLDPGNHGIFYFLDRVPGTYETRYVNAQSRDGTPLWSALSAHGRRVCSLFVPLTYPAVEVNGILASGWLAPSIDDPRYAHPPDLARRIRAVTPEFTLHTGMTEFVRRGRYEEALDRKIRSLQAKAQVAADLLASERWDLFTVVFDETDPIQHYFWHFLDSAHPEFTPEGNRRFGDAILRIYQAADEAVGKLLALTGDDTVVFVISDHGYGPNQRAHLYLKGLLQAHGLQVLARRGLLSRAASGAYRALTRGLPSGLKHRLAGRFRSVHERLETLSYAGDIDWPSTRAYTFWSSGCSEPWINLRGRDPQGAVSPGADCDALVEDLREIILSATDPRTGEPVAQGVSAKADLYHGPHLDRAPDLLIHWRPDLVVSGLATHRRTASASPASVGRSPSSDAAPVHGSRFTVPAVVVSDPIAEDLRTGNHRREGLLLTSSRRPSPSAVAVPGTARYQRAAVAGGEPSSVPVPCPPSPVRRRSLTDLAPTIYALLGVPPPHPLDGRPWTDLFPEAAPLLEPSHASITEASGMTDADLEILERRLSDLGYL
jgi:predicted AlkP superfamily phosphohydrolase/phosphomutase